MADDQFTCKDCGKSGDYDAIPKRRDPRPNVRRVICQDCANIALAEMASDGRTFSRPLVSPKAPYQKSSQTSRDAAQSAAYKVEGQALKVLTVLSEAPEGLTEPQITFMLDMERNESTRAISGLWSKTPYAEKASYTRVNPASGKQVQVYTITQAGREYLAAASIGRAAA